ncbi:MAG: DNA polymerase III subunit gamma/tau [Clostridia bacterium]|nr:DNA polymerase III subunit gamma/tau [Clostridia bacterium]
MAYQALYRKYRPSTFSEVYGQEHITEVLKSELSSDKISHAYLFTGTRGTGKTTCAKILAKAANCLNPKDGNPCNECEMCRAINEDTVTDICEIDAASNNGVNDIRLLREQVNFTPSVAKYRVYIIDEVHMLSTQAFNALLKTLEEPPKHVIFVLATTEVHKLPATVLSRCQRFEFRRIDPEKICERIQFVAGKEGFKVSPDAASLIAATADGGMRDALSILDLCASVTKDITEDTVVSVCAMAGNEYLLKFADYIKKRDVEAALLLIDELHNSSLDMMRLVSEITSHFRDLMIAKTVRDKTLPIVCSTKKLEMIKSQAQEFSLAEILSILEVLRDTAAKMQAGNHRTRVEMMIIRLCNPELGNSLSSLEQRVAALESGNAERPKTVAASEPPKTENREKAPEDVKKEQKPKTEIKDAPKENAGPDKPIKQWDDILAELRVTCPIIAGVLGGSKAYIEGERLLIDAKNEQFRSLINGENPTYRDAIKAAASKILGKKYNLGPYKKINDKPGEDSDPLAAFARKLNELED